MTHARRTTAFAAVLILALSLVACKDTPSQAPSATAARTDNGAAPTLPGAGETATETGADGETDFLSPDSLSLDPGPLAAAVHIDSRPGTPYMDAPAFGGAAPAHLAVTFDQDELSDSPLARQLRVYPIMAWRDLFQAHNPSLIGERVDGLTKLIADRPADLAGPRGGQNEIPVLPLIGAAQVMVAQPRVLDFKDGSGVAFVTTYAQDPQPLTNDNLFYTFQGMTADGRGWISLFYPVRAQGLPASFADSPAAAAPQNFMNGFAAYLGEATSALNGLRVDQFTPDLDQLDAMVRSIAMKAPAPTGALTPAP